MLFVSPNVNEIKYLGVTVAYDLNWHSHIDNIVSKAYKNLYFVMRNLKFASRETKSIAYLTLIRPILEYACSVWDPHQKCLIDKIESVQRKAARLVCNRHDRDVSVTYLLNELGWSRLQDRRTISRLIIMYKIYTNYVSFTELSNRINRPNYVSRHDHQYKIAEINVTSDKEKYSFLARSIKDWNALPSEMFNPFPVNVKHFAKTIRGKL